MRKLKLFSLALMALFSTSLLAEDYVWNFSKHATWTYSSSDKTVTLNSYQSLANDAEESESPIELTFQGGGTSDKIQASSKAFTVKGESVTLTNQLWINGNTSSTRKLSITGLEGTGTMTLIGYTGSNRYVAMGTASGSPSSTANTYNDLGVFLNNAQTSVTSINITTTLTASTTYYINASGSYAFYALIWTPDNINGPFSVVYDANGGTGDEMIDSNSPYVKNTTVTVLANAYTAPTGAEFTGWNTKADGSGTGYDPDDTFEATADITLYAQWAYPATGTGTIEYTFVSNANTVNTDVTGVSTLSSTSTAFTTAASNGLTIAGGDVKDGYSVKFSGQTAAYSDSKYVALQFTVADNYEFTPSAISMTIFAKGTGDMKAKVVLSDGTTSVESNELSCSNSADSDISFAAGAFSGKKFKGDVTIKVLQWGKASKYVYIKSPVTITGTVTEKPAAPISWKLSEAVVDAAEVTYGTTPYVFPALSNDESLAVTYSSSNADVASISNEEGHEGEITVVSAGSANISATYTATAQGAYKTTVVSYALTVNSGSGTALDNTAANAKAVKRIENGMLVIEKNGVRYNAQGQIIH